MESTHGCIATLFLFFYKLIFGVSEQEMKVKQMREESQLGVMVWRPWGGNRWLKNIIMPLPKRKSELGEIDILLIVNRLKGTVFFPSKVDYRWRMKFDFKDHRYFIELDNRGFIRYGHGVDTMGKVTLGYINK